MQVSTYERIPKIEQNFSLARESKKHICIFNISDVVLVSLGLAAFHIHTNGSLLSLSAE